jgi:hypothetical protein
VTGGKSSHCERQMLADLGALLDKSNFNKISIGGDSRLRTRGLSSALAKLDPSLKNRMVRHELLASVPTIGSIPFCARQLLY